ncbi:hypothetical protein NHX12_029546 [Muraenolepis orangiensis]|uniref:Uncharacterized protein n=1 Tax=Muraenolepis orangiensis TaxID=630683 RepID=A0A9Q0IIN0_9TELE|nr:hypothetical protein NHX12_029546 [Muraenolepis orangiensis]
MEDAVCGGVKRPPGGAEDEKREQQVYRSSNQRPASCSDVTPERGGGGGMGQPQQACRSGEWPGTSCYRYVNDYVNDFEEIEVKAPHFVFPGPGSQC